MELENVALKEVRSSSTTTAANSSSVLRAGKRAALIRDSPPWLSRDETSVDSSASAKRS
jgi:hypothetical protein